MLATACPNLVGYGGEGERAAAPAPPPPYFPSSHLLATFRAPSPNREPVHKLPPPAAQALIHVKVVFWTQIAVLTILPLILKISSRNLS